MMPRKKQLTFEESLARLEDIVKSLEKGDSSLDELMQNYQEGVKLGQSCLQELRQAEKTMDLTIKSVKDENGAVVTEPLVIEGE